MLNMYNTLHNVYVLLDDSQRYIRASTPEIDHLYFYYASVMILPQLCLPLFNLNRGTATILNSDRISTLKNIRFIQHTTMLCRIEIGRSPDFPLRSVTSKERERERERAGE